jgi:hypothetical protein
MNSSEIVRLRRQMQRRIRDVVAERRLSRQHDAIGGDAVDQDPVGRDSRSATGEGSLITG